MIVKSKYDINGIILDTGTYYRDPTIASVGGTQARERGMDKTTCELTNDDRVNRLMVMDNTTTSVSNKLYPEGDNTGEHVMQMLLRSRTRSFKGNIIDYPDIVEEECILYTKYCMENHVPVSLSGLSTWLGISRTHVLRLRKSDKPVGLVLENAASWIGDIRIRQADMGNLNPIWNMYILANDNNFTRRDNPGNINIQINQNGYEDTEINNILADADAFDDI